MANSELWNIYNYPELRNQVKEFVELVISWSYPNEKCTKDQYKHIFSQVMKWIRFTNNTEQIAQLSRNINKSYNEFNGRTEKTPSFIKEKEHEKEDSEREVVERAWNRFKEYTALSASKNGRLKQLDNPKVWQWLRNNELSNFSCSTDIYTLPPKIKKLIVKACNYKLDGVSVTVDNENGRKIINLDYLEEVCANCYKLF